MNDGKMDLAYEAYLLLNAADVITEDDAAIDGVRYEFADGSILSVSRSGEVDQLETEEEKKEFVVTEAANPGSWGYYQATTAQRAIVASFDKQVSVGDLTLCCKAEAEAGYMNGKPAWLVEELGTGKSWHFIWK